MAGRRGGDKEKFLRVAPLGSGWRKAKGAGTLIDRQECPSYFRKKPSHFAAGGLSNLILKKPVRL